MEFEHEVGSAGEVSCRGEKELSTKVKSMQHDVEQHGEVHASFQDVDDEVEVRLGTARFNYETHTIDIWDGDNYVPFSMSHLVSWYKPMEVYH